MIKPADNFILSVREENYNITKDKLNVLADILYLIGWLNKAFGI